MKNKYRIDGDIVYIDLIKHNGEILETLIDLEDFDLVSSNNKWHSLKQKRLKGETYYVCGYRIINGVGRTIKLHRLIMNIDNLNFQVDHINHNTLDNRKENLRIVNCQGNSFNKYCKGYYWHKNSKKWKAYIYLNNKNIHLGYYDNEDDAKNAYIEAKEKYHIINEKEIVKDDKIYNQTPSPKKGYSWSKQCNKWRAEIFVNGKNKYLGLFTTEEEARQAYLDAKEFYHKID